jgi:hypothetical protein
MPSARCFLGPKESNVPHNTESARATVLEPKRLDEATPMRDPVNHVHIVGALIGGIVLFVMAAIAIAVSE